MRTYSILLIVLSFATELTEAACKFKTPCACTKDDGKVINLANLGKLQVKDTASMNDYLWKPCKNFDIGTLKGVTFVQHALNTKMYYDIGTDPNVAFKEETDKVMLDITSKLADRKSTVLLNCSSAATQFAFQGEFPGLTYNFVLSSPYCCPGYTGPSEGLGLSIGSIITIVFFSIMILYMIFGVIYQVKARKAEGVERIPNVSFWSALPGLIKDGIKFTTSCGSRDRSVYGQI